jgi:hypothetical protein
MPCSSLISPAGRLTGQVIARPAGRYRRDIGRARAPIVHQLIALPRGQPDLDPDGGAPLAGLDRLVLSSLASPRAHSLFTKDPYSALTF